MIGERLATLRELEEYYGYSDLLDMAEVIMVRRNNELAAQKHAERK